MVQPIDEVLGYDADHDDESQYCVHGTFIGSWWGPDYLCGWCEDGVSLEDFRRYQTRKGNRLRRKNTANLWFYGVGHITIKEAPLGYQQLIFGLVFAMARHLR